MWRNSNVSPYDHWETDGPEFVYCNACDQVFQYRRSGPRDRTDMDIQCPICARSTSLEKTVELLEKSEAGPAGVTLADWGVVEA